MKRALLRARHRRHKARNVTAGVDKRIAAMEVFLDSLFQTRREEAVLNNKLRREIEQLQRYVTFLQLQVPLEVRQQAFAEIQ